jgi:cytosine/adenosine deaminase-related metal-dependent hydrolase
MTTTWIKNADWIVAWDAGRQTHAYLRNADLVFSGNRIEFVGKDYQDSAGATQIDGRGLAVLPGLINLHSHPSGEPLYRGIREDHGVPEQYMTGLYERLQAFHADADAALAAAEVAYCELLLSGVTTLADLSFAYPGWLELLARSGLRGYLAPAYASSRWFMENRHQLKFAWDEAAGERGFEQARELIGEAQQHPSGRLAGMVCPMQIDTCTPQLFEASIAYARDHHLPITTHISQSVPEFYEMVDRHGITPIQWAHEIGLLGTDCILGHAIFVDRHSWLHWWSRNDIDLLAQTGTSVAHCPTPFARYGATLEHFGDYRRVGVNLGFGTDTTPHNLLEEMRLGLILGRVAAGAVTSVDTADVFHAATVGGARALQRSDLGRLAPEMKADLLLVDCGHPLMQPVRDPLRSLIHAAADRAVRDVYIDGQLVVQNHRVLHLDHAGALERAAAGQQRMETAVPQHDYLGRGAGEISPLSLALLDTD